MIRIVLNMIVNAFCAPWRDRGRALILLAGMVGSFGAGVQRLYLNYTLAGQGFGVTAPFQMMHQALLGFIGVPLALWLLAMPWGRWKIFGLQCIGFGLFCFGLPNAFLPALAYFFAASPFWALYSARYARRQTIDNRGNETALSTFLLILSAAISMWGGGLLMDAGYGMSLMLGGTAMIIVATQLLFRPEDNPFDIGVLRRSLRWRHAAVRFTVLGGILYTLIESCIPIWFRVIGLSAGTTGWLMGIRVIISFLLTPVVGHLIQKDTLRAGIAGGAMLVGGWALLYYGQQDPPYLTAALVALSIATNLINPAETNRWYKRRRVEAIAAREGLLAAGRVPSFLLVLPAIFYSPTIYPFVGLGMSLVFLFTLRPPGQKKK